MNDWDARDILFTSLCGDVRMDVDLTARPIWQKFILAGLHTGFYPGGQTLAMRIYKALVEAAAVHGLWVKKSRHYSWTVYPVGNRPKAFNQELHDRYVADCLAWNLQHYTLRVYDGYAPTHGWFRAHTRTLKDTQWLKSLAAKYIDDDYRRRVEPFIKRVENGRLIVRRTNGKWSIE